MAIDVSSLTSDDVGRFVIYKDGKYFCKKGRIKNWDTTHIYVVWEYQCRGMIDRYQDFIGYKTDPNVLDWDCVS